MVTVEQKRCLEQWAKADDRSTSYILRDILKQECDRRNEQQNRQATRQEVKYQAN
jgi:predicted transcriptional regulator